ncbi:aspartic protease 4 isoform X2 [Halyomorpha halys]|uniref:aspartic protease 4 isoform X2 n=1 Tax=Halyomorpha halys TaxID=286706 RepID=UPI0034D27ACD
MNKLVSFVIVALSLAALSEAQVRIQLSRQEIALKREKIKPYGHVNLLRSVGVPQIIRNYRNVYYYGYIRLGTPGDLVRVIFDTGSPSLWVYSGSGWSSWWCIPCWFHKTYRHSASSTYSPDGRRIEISYVSGYMRGYISQDILSIGDLSARVQFAEATSTPIMDSLWSKYDGILGLAPCSGARCQVYKEFPPSVVNPLMQQLPCNIFSIYLDRTDRGYGEITFGGTNTLLYKQETLVMHNTTTTYMWSLRIDSVWVGETLALNYTNGINAFIDTGTSLIVGPPDDVVVVLQLMNLKLGLEVDCETRCELPPISFVIEGQKYSLNWKQYAYLTQFLRRRKGCGQERTKIVKNYALIYIESL